jgi:hypothetical protein
VDDDCRGLEWTLGVVRKLLKTTGQRRGDHMKVVAMEEKGTTQSAGLEFLLCVLSNSYACLFL